MIKEALKQAWTQARSHRVVTLLYVAGVALAVATVMGLSIIWHVKLSPLYPEYNRERLAYLRQIRASFSSGGMQWNGISSRFDHAWLDSLEHAEAVAKVCYSGSMAMVNDNVAALTKCTNADFFKVYDYEFLSGRPYTDADDESGAFVTVIDDLLAKQLFGDWHAAQDQTIKINGDDYRVVGVVKHGSWLLPLSYAQAFRPLAHERERYPDWVGPIKATFLLKSGSTFDQLRQEVAQRVARTQEESDGFVELDIMDQPVSHYEIAFDDSGANESPYTMGMMIFAAVILLLVPAVNLCGLMAESVGSRLSEIGVRKSFGASRASLLTQILLENLALTIVGAFLGLFAAWIVVKSNSAWIFDVFNDGSQDLMTTTNPDVPLTMLISVPLFLITLASALVLCAEATLWPAWRCLNRPITYALATDGGAHSQPASSRWGRWLSNSWIVVELVLITVLAWVVLDPLVVRKYDQSRPLGYEPNRMAIAFLGAYPEQSPKYNKEMADSAGVMSSYYRMIEMLRSLPEVEYATPLIHHAKIEDMSADLGAFTGTTGDTVLLSKISFVPGNDFFETYGIKLPEGMGDVSNRSYSESEVLISHEAARRLFGQDQVAGESMVKIGGYGLGDSRCTVVGTADDVRLKSFMDVSSVVFTPVQPGWQWLPLIQFQVALRLKPGVDPEHFAREHQDWLKQEAHAGNFYGRWFNTMDTQRDTLCISNGIVSQNRIDIALAVFFLINLFLGVVGTFYLQTQRRAYEAGIRKSFGAWTGNILRRLMGEGCLLTVGAWALGCLIFLQYALKTGLAESECNVAVMLNDSWVRHFWGHFGIISLIVLGVMLVAVVLGVILPGWRIARTEPIEALKEE
ncbi:MAG: ABC transporter permease [Bacteroidales bacterium]|nr:ABC transporter permease [Bacteroidales bacterium]